MDNKDLKEYLKTYKELKKQEDLEYQRRLEIYKKRKETGDKIKVKTGGEGYGSYYELVK